MNDANKQLIYKGSVIQVTDEDLELWYGCLFIVDEVKPWGVQAGMKIPEKGFTFIRLLWEQFEWVGTSHFMFGGAEGEHDGRS